MAATLRAFLLPDDERALFRLLAPHALSVYPEAIPAGFEPPVAEEGLVERLDEPAYYLAAERLGPVVVRPVGRGPSRGMLEIEEVPSPVLHYERSLPNERGELVGGRLWAELDVTGDPRSRLGKPLALRALFEEIHRYFRKQFRRGDPKGWWIGPRAAAAVRSGGLVLREPGRRGRVVRVWRWPATGSLTNGAAGGRRGPLTVSPVGRYKAALAAAALLAPALAAAERVAGAVLPDESRQVGAYRYRIDKSFDDALKFFRSVYPPGRYPRRPIANQPGVKAVHIANPEARPGSWEGLNVYEWKGETRVYVLVAQEKKPRR